MAKQELKASVLWAMRGLALAALALSIYIVWTAYAGGQLAGCGEGGGCEEVIRTRWSSWFTLPVGAGGALVYAAILLSLFGALSPSRWRRLIVLTVLAAGSGLWFIGLQLLIIKGFCLYCTTVHTCGILLMGLTLWKAPVEKPLTPKEAKRRGEVLVARHVVRSGVLGLIGVAVLAGGQLLSDRRVTVPENPPPMKVELPSVSIQEVALASGRMRLKPGDYPTVGSPNAERNIVMLFDYTCPACRHLHPQLLDAYNGHEATTAIVMVPMPLDSQCNHGVQQTSYQHLNACLFAKIGLAVWNANPSAYAAFDKFMFETEYPPSAEQARAMADHLVGKEIMDAALADPRFDQLVSYGVQLFYSPLLQKKVLPTLITPEQVLEGTPPPEQLSLLF